MKMKRNVLALAISSGMVMAPAAAMADGPEVYGLVDIGLETLSDSDDASGGEIFSGFNSESGDNASPRGEFKSGASSNKDFQLSNGLQSRIGVRGSEELDWGGLTASYNIELAVDVLNERGGAMASSVGTRLGWAALGGDWGTVKVGSQWQPLFEFGGWNTHRTDVHGYGTYFYTTEIMGQQSGSSLRYGFRQSSAISYQYGSAWGHSDSFAFNVTLGIGEGETEIGERTTAEVGGQDDVVVDNRETVTNEEGISSVAVAGQYSFDQRISVNAVYLKEFTSFENGGDANFQPELINVGARYSVTDALEFAINYTQVDTDNENSDKRDSFAIASFMDFGNGLDGHLGFATGSDDRDDETFAGRDIDLNAYGFVRQALSDRTNVRLEFEHVKYDGYLDDASASLAMVALQHNF